MTEQSKKVLPFSDARRVGNCIYVSGQIPKDMETGEWGKDISKQTLTCLNRIKKILSQHEAKVADIVKTTVFLTNINDYGAMNKTYLSFFQENDVVKDLPARSVVEVGKLMFPEWFIELDCVAILPEK